MIFVALILAALTVVVFVVLIVGIQVTDHRMRLRDPDLDGRADAFARRVLGVYVQQPTASVLNEDMTTRCGGERRWPHHA